MLGERGGEGTEIAIVSGWGGGVGAIEGGIGVGEGGYSEEGRKEGKMKGDDPEGGRSSWARGEVLESSTLGIRGKGMKGIMSRLEEYGGVE